MPRGVKKEHLPSKICETCGRPFTWRKKWERCWEEVRCCSKRCKAARRAAPRVAAGAPCAVEPRSSSMTAHGADVEGVDLEEAKV